MTKERSGAAMRDCTEMFNESGEHIATIGFNESYGLWQIVVVQRRRSSFSVQARKSRSPPGTTNSIPKLDSHNRLHALAAMLDLSVSSRNGLLCNFWIADESNYRAKIDHVANT
jgi:hypothetical protein